MSNIEKIIYTNLLKDSNNKITELNNINQYLTEYSTTISHIIPIKYKQTITDNLKNLTENHNIPLIYTIQDLENNNFLLILLNHGVNQREQILKQIKKS